MKVLKHLLTFGGIYVVIATVIVLTILGYYTVPLIFVLCLLVIWLGIGISNLIPK